MSIGQGVALGFLLSLVASNGIWTGMAIAHQAAHVMVLWLALTALVALSVLVWVNRWLLGAKTAGIHATFEFLYAEAKQREQEAASG